VNSTLDDYFLRLEDIIGDPLATPPVPARVPVSATTWWRGIRAGFFPPGVRISPGVVVWKASAIAELIKNPKNLSKTGKPRGRPRKIPLAMAVAGTPPEPGA
jgi:predicted DNA-binding transcriptional regulator AlpA